MMEQRTLNIINICKGNTKYNNYSHIENIKEYMSDECGCTVDDYTENDIFDIIKTAFYDYINHCDKPDIFFKEMEEFLFIYNLELTQLNIIKAMCSGFRMAQVKRKKDNIYYYVNGFDDRLFLLDREMI